MALLWRILYYYLTLERFPVRSWNIQNAQ